MRLQTTQVYRKARKGSASAFMRLSAFCQNDMVTNEGVCSSDRVL